MRTASDAFNRAAMNGNVVARVECDLADGSHVEFGPQDIMQGGVAATGATSNSGGFGIGCAVIGRCTISLLNDHRQLNGTPLSGACVIPYVGAGVEGGIEWLRLGTYYVEPFDIYDNVVTLTCYDSLSRMEVPCPIFEGPITLGALVAGLCGHCGLALGTETFPNSDYSIRSVPDLSNVSCLEALAYVAQVAGCYVAVDEYGDVCLRWYDLEATVEDSLDGGGFHFEVDDADGGGFHFEVDTYSGGKLVMPYGVTTLKSITAGVTPHTVTGLAVSDVEGTQHVSGEDGYVLHIKDNPLVEGGRAADVAANVAPRVLGFALRSVRVTTPGSPVIQAGDFIGVTDRFDETYDFFATSVSWSISGTLSMSCDVESSSPLVRTYRRANAGASVDAAQVASIVDGILDTSLADLSELESFGDISTALDDLGTDLSDLDTALGDLATDVDGLDTSVTGLDDRVTVLEQGTSVGQWIIQVDGVAQTTGVLNFVTIAPAGSDG